MNTKYHVLHYYAPFLPDGGLIVIGIREYVYAGATFYDWSIYDDGDYPEGINIATNPNLTGTTAVTLTAAVAQAINAILNIQKQIAS